MKMLNLNCRLINFLHHLKSRCGLASEDCVDLMDSSGRVMNLDVKQHSENPASCFLTERQLYVLLRVHRDDETGGCRYVSLLDHSNQHQPELTELMKKLSKLNKEPERRRGRGGSKKISVKKKQ
nr:uncharacterized protein C22orf15 [Nothobranchius furzeri]